GPGSIELLWHALADSGPWSVEIPAANVALSQRRVNVGSLHPHDVWRTAVTGLEPGREFDYRVRYQRGDGYRGKGKAPKSASQPWRFVAFGDTGVASDPESKIALQTQTLDPDLAFIAGDIVYSYGQASDYGVKFFTPFNSTHPLMHRIPFVAAAGNHDTETR